MAHLVIATVESTILANSYYEVLTTTKIPTDTVDGEIVVTDADDVFLVKSANITAEELRALLDAKLIKPKDAAARFHALSLAVDPNVTNAQLYEALIKHDFHPEIVSAVNNMGKSFLTDPTNGKLWRSSPDYNWDLMEAAFKGHLEKMKLLKSCGATDYDWALARAAAGGQLDAMKLLKSWGATDFDWALARAAGGGRLEAMNLLKHWGATDFYCAKALAHENAEAMELITSWIDE
jgi:hypothetical protein